MNPPVMGQCYVACRREARFPDATHTRDLFVVILSTDSWKRADCVTSLRRCWWCRAGFMTGGIHRDEAPPVFLRFCCCLCRSRLELEASLWGKFGLGFLELIAKCLDSLRIGTLVIWGEIISGIGDVLGEP